MVLLRRGAWTTGRRPGRHVLTLLAHVLVVVLGLASEDGMIGPGSTVSAATRRSDTRPRRRAKRTRMPPPAPPAPGCEVPEAHVDPWAVPLPPGRDVPPLAPTSHEPALLRVAAVGDIMMGSTYPDATGGGLPPEDGARMLDEVAPVLRAADLAFGNLEGPLVDGGTSVKCGPARRANCYAFRVPTRYGEYLAAAGFDVLSLANNHAMDFGADGRASSRAVLDAHGIRYTGEPGTAARLEIAGRTVEVIAFATYGHSTDLNDLDEARRLVRQAAARADLVIVSFHGGAEGGGKCRVPDEPELFHGENRGHLRRFAHAVIDEGADLVLGHGPHVLRGLELHRDRLIAYSLGNFATYGGFNLRGLGGLGAILEVDLAPDGRFVGGRIHPIRQLSPGGPRLDVERRAIPLLGRLGALDFAGATPEITFDGHILPRVALPPEPDATPTPGAPTPGAGADVSPEAPAELPPPGGG